MSNSTVSNRPAAKPGTTGIGGSLKENKFPKVRRSLSPQMNIKAGDPPLVQITLTYPSRTVKRQVENPKIQNLVKAVANDQMRSASRAMTAIDLPGVLQEVCKVIEKEVNLLTSLKVNSMLRRTTKEDFSQFSFQKLFLELKTNAPCLVQLACAAMNFNIHCVDEKEQARVCCTLSPMLKTRNKEMSAMAYLTSFVLKHGGCKQQDFERVARMGYSVTPRAAARKLQLISCSMDSDYDEILAAWKSNSKVEKVVTSLWEILHARIVLPKPMLDMLIDANLVEVVLTNEFSSDIHTLSELIKNGFPLDVSSYPYTVEMESTRNYLNKKFLEATTAETPRISIAGDNWDKRIIPTYISSESQGEDLHLFMLVLLVDRVSTPSNLASTTPQKKVSDMNNEDLLPNESEQVLLRSELSFIVGKCGVSHIPALEKLFAHIMPKTYPHLLQGIFSQKSKQYVLGLFDINENKTKDMISLLKLISEKYVPTFVSSSGQVEVAEPIFFGGDRLTDERAQGAKRAMSNATTSLKKLDGIIPKIEDFHRGMNFFEAIHKLTYSKSSSAEVGTVNYFRNLLRHKTVSNKVTLSYRPNRNLYYIINDAQICSFLLRQLNMGSIDDNLDLPEEWDEWDDDAKLMWFQKECGDVIDKYFFEDKMDITDKIRGVLKDRAALENLWLSQLSEENRYCCHHCDNTYAHLKSVIAHEDKVHGQKTATKSKSAKAFDEERDEAYNYQLTVFKLTLLHRNLESATDCGDGLRSIRSSKYEMLIYSRTNKIKYLIACVQLQTLIQAKLSEQQAFRLTWNRTVNTCGGASNNEAIDGWVELINREVKRMCSGNQTKETCLRHAAAFKAEIAIVDQIDTLLKRKKRKGFHKIPQRMQEVRKVLKELLPLLTHNPGREMKTPKLRNLGNDIFDQTPANLSNMLTTHRLLTFDILH